MIIPTPVLISSNHTRSMPGPFPLITWEMEVEVEMRGISLSPKYALAVRSIAIQSVLAGNYFMFLRNLQLYSMEPLDSDPKAMQVPIQISFQSAVFPRSLRCGTLQIRLHHHQWHN